MSILYRFRDILCWTKLWPWNQNLTSLTCECVHVLYTNRRGASSCRCSLSKIFVYFAVFHTPISFDALAVGVPLGLTVPYVCVKVRVRGLTECENRVLYGHPMNICLHSVPACDRRTDGRTDRLTASPMSTSCCYSVAECDEMLLQEN